MNIAFIVTDLSNVRIGGISRVATEVAVNMAALGHRVTCYVLHRPGQARPGEYRGVRLRYIDHFSSPNPDYPVMGFSRRAFKLFCADAGRQRFDILQSFNLNGIAAPKFSRNLKKMEIPLVLASFETILMDVRAKTGEFFSMPSVKTLAQIVFESYLAVAHERRYLGLADLVVTEDENTAAALRRMGIDGARIRLAPSGVDVAGARDALPPDIDIRQGQKGPVIGYLGRVDPRKGVQYLIAAMAGVKKRFPEAVLFLAGGSRHGYDREVRALISRNGLDDCVRVLGRIEGDILPYYKLADLVVIPSLSEGIPITLGEAMAAGVPVAITRLPGVVPFVKPADLVFWADMGDPVSLSRAIVDALADPDRAVRVRAASEFISGYSWRSVAGRYLDIYGELVGAGQ